MPLGVSGLRPHIVWFGEAVPMINKASKLVGNADEKVIVALLCRCIQLLV